MNETNHEQSLRDEKPAKVARCNGAAKVVRSDFADDEQWRQVLRVAWRPAWQIRSRKGCLAPFVRWWKERRHPR